MWENIEAGGILLSRRPYPIQPRPTSNDQEAYFGSANVTSVNPTSHRSSSTTAAPSSMPLMPVNSHVHGVRIEREGTENCGNYACSLRRVTKKKANGLTTCAAKLILLWLIHTNARIPWNHGYPSHVAALKNLIVPYCGLFHCRSDESGVRSASGRCQRSGHPFQHWIYSIRTCKVGAS